MLQEPNCTVYPCMRGRGVQIPIPSTEKIINPYPNKENREIPNIDVLKNPNPHLFCIPKCRTTLFSQVTKRQIPFPNLLFNDPLLPYGIKRYFHSLGALANTFNRLWKVSEPCSRGLTFRTKSNGQVACFLTIKYVNLAPNLPVPKLPQISYFLWIV